MTVYPYYPITLILLDNFYPSHPENVFDVADQGLGMVHMLDGNSDIVAHVCKDFLKPFFSAESCHKSVYRFSEKIHFSSTTCATCSELPSNIRTLGNLVISQIGQKILTTITFILSNFLSLMSIAAHPL